LHGAPLRVGHLHLGLPRTHGCTKRMIESAPPQKQDEAAGRRAAYQVRGNSSMYAISIEQSHAVTILKGSRPFRYRSWRTDHRGLLLIHAWKQKTPKGLSASPPGVASNALLGVVELVDCITITSGHPGADPDEVEYHWVLANPRVFARPLPYIGRTGLFLVSREVVAASLEDVEAPAKRRGGRKVSTPSRRRPHERI